MEKNEDFERSLYVKDYDLKSSVGGSLTGSEIGGQRVIRLTTGCIVFLLTVAVVHLMPTSSYTISSSSGAGCSQGLGSHWSLCWVGTSENGDAGNKILASVSISVAAQE